MQAAKILWIYKSIYILTETLLECLRKLCPRPDGQDRGDVGKGRRGLINPPWGFVVIGHLEFFFFSFFLFFFVTQLIASPQSIGLWCNIANDAIIINTILFTGWLMYSKLCWISCEVKKYITSSILIITAFESSQFESKQKFVLFTIERKSKHSKS